MIIILIGINKKWNDWRNGDGMSSVNSVDNNSTANSPDNMASNTKGENRESDHDYGFAPGRNGHHSHEDVINENQNNASSKNIPSIL